jgi:hypothetical protein
MSFDEETSTLSSERRAAMESMVPPEAAPPGPHPEPPADLHHHSLPISTIRAGSSWSRIHLVEYSPEYFDATNRHRFNAPAGEFGTLYAGIDDACAFIETFGRELELRVVTMTELALRGRSRVEAVQDLHLVDLTGPGLARIRADGRLTTGDYRIAQRWSLALHQHPDRPDGLVWRSRFDPSRTCLAIYERARPAIRTTPLGGLTDSEYELQVAAILDRYDFALV